MGLKIPRSKGRAGSIPASGTKQIKGLHEILRAGPLFFAPQKIQTAPQFSISAPPPVILPTYAPWYPIPEGMAIID